MAPDAPRRRLTPEDFDRRSALGRLADLLERQGIDVADVGRVARINAWQGFIKNADGEPEPVDLVGMQFSPAWEDGPQWPVVQPAAQAPVKAKAAQRARRADVTRWVVLPDPQIGYRLLVAHAEEVAGERRVPMVPMHDEAAMDVALQLLRAADPDEVVNVGDFLDLPEWSSKFLVLPEFVDSTQPALNRGHRFLAEQRANAPRARIRLLEGNHDDRLAKAVIRNAMAAMRLRPGGEPPGSWPLLSMPRLLSLDTVGVEYVAGYPAANVVISEGTRDQAPLVVVHGEGFDAKTVARTERRSIIQGHTHHAALHTVTYDVGAEPLEVFVLFAGCLARIDGAVPSTKSGVDAFGNPVRRVESWQHAVVVVDVLPDGSYWPELVRIRDGRAVWQGRVFAAS